MSLKDDGQNNKNQRQTAQIIRQLIEVSKIVSKIKALTRTEKRKSAYLTVYTSKKIVLCFGKSILGLVGNFGLCCIIRFFPEGWVLSHNCPKTGMQP